MTGNNAARPDAGHRAPDSPSRRVRRGARGFLAAGVGVLALSLGLGTGQAVSAAPVVAADEPIAEWTMMVYAVADTSDIGGDMAWNLASLANLPDDPETNVVVLVDMVEPSQAGASGPPQTLPGLGPFTTAKLLVLEGGKFHELRDLGEASMANPDTLATFIAEAADRFPAEQYGLTLMDHGGANIGGYLDLAPAMHMMTIPDIRNGILSGLQRADIDRFDVLFHSACLMSNYETASALGPLAGVMAGSEELLYTTGMLPHRGFTTAQAGGTGTDIGRSFLDGYAEIMERAQQEIPEYAAEFKAIRDLTALSLIEGAEVAALDQAMQSFSNVAVEHMDEIVNSVARARADSLEFMINAPLSGGVSGDLIDLGDFLAHLQDLPDDVAVARDAVHAALKSAVSHQVTGSGTSQATGLNIYLPTNRQKLGNYLTDGSAPPGWGAFVEAFLDASEEVGSGEQAAQGAQFVSPEAEILESGSAGIKIVGQLVSGGAASVVDQETQVYTRVGDQANALALVLPAYLNAGGEGAVQGVWSHSLTVLTDGQKSVPATAFYQAQEGGLNGGFLAQYASPAGDITEIGVRVLLSSEGAIESVSTFSLSGPDGEGAAGADLEIGGRITPYVFIPSSGSFAQTLSSQSIVINEDLSVDFEPLPSGTRFDMGVVVADAAGNADAAFVSSQVP